MFYHCFARQLDNQWYVLLNKDKDRVIKEVVDPFVHGQIKNITHATTGKQILFNFKTLVTVSVYRTKKRISKTLNEKGIPTFIASDECHKFDCTDEVVEEVRSSHVSPRIRSILEMNVSSSKKQMFVIMNLNDKLMDSTYDVVIEPVAKEFGLEPVRIDKRQDSGRIDDQILAHIAQSKFVLSDLTGERPNCYYETGFAHALGKELILTIKKGSVIHFDLRGYRFIEWETDKELKGELIKRLNVICKK
jgi:hypothetical protein